MKQSKPLPKGAKVAIALVVVITVIAIIAVLAPDSGNAGQREPATDNNGQTISTTTQTPAQAPAEDTIAVNQTIAVNGLSYTATEIKRSKGASLNSPANGNVFIGVKFTVENSTSENKIVPALGLFDTYADNAKYLYSANSLMAFGNPIGGDLAPGKQMVGWHAIEVPSDAKTLTLEFGLLYRDSANNKFVFEIPQG